MKLIMENILKKLQPIKSGLLELLLSGTFILSGCVSSGKKYPAKVHEILKLSHRNRKEIEKALDFFIVQKDSLKIRAISFLVENMANKYSLVPADRQDPFHTLILKNHMKESEAWNSDKSRLGAALDSVYKLHIHPPQSQMLRDVEVVTGDYLIKNVEEAFKSWEHTKKFTRCSFDDFCEYILPYRIGNEPLSDWREQAYHKFSYLSDSIRDPLELTKAIVRTSGIYYNAGMNKYPFLPTFSELDHLHWGSCDHLAAYLALSLRAVGIPSTIDVVPAWANRGGGHVWNVVMDKDGDFVDIGFNGEGRNVVSYKIPKIYRTVYSNNKSDVRLLNPIWKDVTENYRMPISDISLPESDPGMEGRARFLCIFNNKDWIPVAASTDRKDGSVTFRNVARGIPFGDNQIAGYENEGKGIVYLPISVHNGVTDAFEAPFILKENGDVHWLAPDHSVLRSISLCRKYPKYGHISVYAGRMTGGCFEISDRADFSAPRKIYTIKEPPEHSIAEIRLHAPVTCRYILYMAPDNSWVNISELQCYSQDGKLSGTPFSSDKTKLPEELAKICDGNIDTFYAGEPQHAYVGIDFGKEVDIDAIIYSPRTDGNDIISGEEYELFYWKSRWVSLGRKKADSFHLKYDNVPDNSLLWLHNRTKGVEERIFTYVNNKQIWW